METSPEALLQGSFIPVHPVAYDDINDSLIMQAASKKSNKQQKEAADYQVSRLMVGK